MIELLVPPTYLVAARRAVIATLAVALIAFSADAALAAPGGLDPGFGQAGSVGIVSAGNEAATAVPAQPDGKIVVAGGDVVYRLNGDGSLDPTFNDNGRLGIASDRGRVRPRSGAAARRQDPRRRLRVRQHRQRRGRPPAQPERIVRLELISLRASQINGCGACAVQHPRIARKLGETDERIFAVAAWRDAPYFTEAERAALALTEAATRLSDRAEAVPDAIWDEAARHYDETALAGLVMAIANINVWNRLNVTTRQVAGAEW